MHGVDSQILLWEGCLWALEALRKLVEWRNSQMLLGSCGRPMRWDREANSEKRKSLKESWRKGLDLKRLWALESYCLGLNPS